MTKKENSKNRRDKAIYDEPFERGTLEAFYYTLSKFSGNRADSTPKKDVNNG